MRHELIALTGLAVIALSAGGCSGTVRRDPPARVAPKAVVGQRVGLPHDGTLAANRAAARRDVAAMVKMVPLPAGAVRASHEPSGDHGWLKAPQAILSDRAAATAHAWWTLPEPAEAVIDYLDAHRPARATEPLRSSGGNIVTGTSDATVGYQWSPVGNVLSGRTLDVTVTALSDGRTGVLANAESEWIVPRSPGERVPAGVTAVRVVLQRAPKRIGSDRLGPVSRGLITAPESVTRAVRLVDGLGVIQPEVMMCTMDALPAGDLEVTYSAGPAGPALAQAKVTLFAGTTNGGANGCDPITFSIRGHVQRALAGTSFLKQVEALAAISGG